MQQALSDVYKKKQQNQEQQQYNYGGYAGGSSVSQNWAKPWTGYSRSDPMTPISSGRFNLQGGMNTQWGNDLYSASSPFLSALLEYLQSSGQSFGTVKPIDRSGGAPHGIYSSLFKGVR